VSASNRLGLASAAIHYVAQRWANAQLGKVHRRTVSNLVWILALDKNAGGLLKARLDKPVKRRWEVDSWKLSSRNQDPNDVMLHNNQTVRSAKEATTSTYDGSVSDMTAVYAKSERLLAQGGKEKSK